MKRRLACLLMLLLLWATALAEERVSIPLADGALSLVPYEKGWCLTKETGASVFNRLGMSQRKVLAQMEDQQLEALLYPEDCSFQTLLSIIASEEPAFSDYTEAERAQLAGAYTS